MGTPGFAVPSLDILVQNGYNIVGVITSTDKYGGRGNKQLLESAVKKYALSKGLNVLQPKNLKSTTFIEELKALKADLQIVVAFRMLPVVVWDMPPIGTFNLHGSLLPKYRGAAPINWAIINGEKETGLTTFFLKHDIDTGNILFQEKTPIGPEENVGDLHDRMMTIGAELVLKTVKAVEKGETKATQQDNSLVCHAPKLFKETCEINFDQPAQKVHDFIRGLSPYPTAWTLFEDKPLKIFKAKPIIQEHNFKPGTVHTDQKSYFHLATEDGFMEILDLQVHGKKRMAVKAFLNGYRFKEN